MDLSIEAIEQDLMNAETRAGQPIAAVYLKRAEIRARLRATIPDDAHVESPITIGVDDVDIWVLGGELGDCYIIPNAAVGDDRTEVAARILGVAPAHLGQLLAMPMPSLVSPEITVEDDDDFFAEAKKERKK